MDTKDIVVNNGCEWHAVKSTIAFFPDFFTKRNSKSIFALIFERLFMVVLLKKIANKIIKSSFSIN